MGGGIRYSEMEVIRICISVGISRVGNGACTDLEDCRSV